MKHLLEKSYFLSDCSGAEVFLKTRMSASNEGI